MIIQGNNTKCVFTMCDLYQQYMKTFEMIIQGNNTKCVFTMCDLYQQYMKTFEMIIQGICMFMRNII